MNMEINKQLFEDILSGKLKGIFISKSGKVYTSDILGKNHGVFGCSHPYVIMDIGSYTQTGLFQFGGTSQLDIIDFKPDKSMNELKIEIPENKEIDWQESAKQEKIVFKKKENTKPRSWEEYCRQQKDMWLSGYYINNVNTEINQCNWREMTDPSKWTNVLPSRELVLSFQALMQLMSLRHDWIHKWSMDNGMTYDWKPDWKDHTQLKANIFYGSAGFDITYFKDLNPRPLSFPTKEIAADFMNCFEDLLEIAKPLIG